MSCKHDNKIILVTKKTSCVFFNLQGKKRVSFLKKSNRYGLPELVCVRKIGIDGLGRQIGIE